ncbi:MAG TPA: OmpA family protein [Candidatus Dormibacteraeota bacterium]|nr:OmpA family protein [Candidatus Dormibacteraeota bacterium]
MKMAFLLLAVTASCNLGAAPTFAQTVPPSHSVATVSRSTKALNYRRAGGSTKIDFQGTDLMPSASGEAKVESKSNRIEIDAKFERFQDSTKFGFEYLTYVLWAISPQGRAVNLGEVAVKNGSSRLKAITDMQTFGMIVTAEPYFAVTQPGDMVVAENIFGPATLGKVEDIDASYQLIGRGAYSTKIDNAIFGIDQKTPRELFEARNAVRIAHLAQADKYAASTLAKAEQKLRNVEDIYARRSDKKSVEAAARDVVETAEEARVMAVKLKGEEDARAKDAADKKAAEEREAQAKASALAEGRRRQEAEQARTQAESAKAEAERMKQESDKAAQQAALQFQAAEREKQEAEKARAEAMAQQQAAIEMQHAAEAESAKARQAAAQSEAEKAELRAQLLSQLNSILQTRDSARGLIVNMSDVLFDTGSSTLKPGAREKLAKISGIVLAHPGLTLQIEGHTDSVGSDEFNQQLSERRADSVRDFLIQQGVAASTIAARGFGKSQPVASNDTPEGRQRNRRVELVVNGASIGTATSPAAANPVKY